MVTGQISGLKPNQNTSGRIPEATMGAYTPVALVWVSLGHSVQNSTEAIFWKYGSNVCVAGSPSSRSAMAIYEDRNPGIQASAGGPLDMARWPWCCHGLILQPNVRQIHDVRPPRCHVWYRAGVQRIFYRNACTRNPSTYIVETSSMLIC